MLKFPFLPLLPTFALLFRRRSLVSLHWFFKNTIGFEKIPLFFKEHDFSPITFAGPDVIHVFVKCTCVLRCHVFIYLMYFLFHFLTILTHCGTEVCFWWWFTTSPHHWFKDNKAFSEICLSVWATGYFSETAMFISYCYTSVIIHFCLGWHSALVWISDVCTL